MNLKTCEQQQRPQWGGGVHPPTNHQIKLIFLTIKGSKLKIFAPTNRTTGSVITRTIFHARLHV